MDGRNEGRREGRMEGWKEERKEGRVDGMMAESNEGNDFRDAEGLGEERRNEGKKREAESGSEEWEGDMKGDRIGRQEGRRRY